MLMSIQNLVRLCQFILKILSGNQIFTESWNNGITERWRDGMTEGQGESSIGIAPLFQSGAIITIFLMKIFNFHHLKNLCILHGYVFVMQFCDYLAFLCKILERADSSSALGCVLGTGVIAALL